MYRCGQCDFKAIRSQSAFYFFLLLFVRKSILITSLYVLYFTKGSEIICMALIHTNKSPYCEHALFTLMPNYFYKLRKRCQFNMH